MRESQHLMDASETGRVDTYSDPATEVAILWDSVPKSKIGLYATLVLEVAVVVFLTVVVFVDLYVKHPGRLSTTDHALYVTGTTIIASAISALGTSQIRVYWLARILPKFKRVDRSGVKNNLARGRTVLGLGTWQQQIHHRLVALTMIVAGLTTAAIVAAISPTVALVDQPLTAGLTYDDFSFDFYVSPNYYGDWFNWALSNGSYLNLNTSMKKFHYSTSAVRMVPQYIDAPSPLGFPYAVQEFVVDPLAIGVPLAVYGGGFPVSLGPWAPGSEGFPLLQYLVGCFPVLISNPVKCTRTGNLTASAHEIITESNLCRITSPIYTVDPTSQPASSLGACTHDQPIGKATLVIGSLYQHADFLAEVMNDKTFASSSTNTSYVVSCEVDIAPSIGFRMANFSRITDETADGGGFGEDGATFVVRGSDQACTPMSKAGPLQISDIITDSMLATGAAASWQILFEGAYRDGWWNRLWYAAMQRNDTIHNDNSYHLDFNDSRNSLEDVLGIASGIALGSFWGAMDGTPYYDYDVTASIQGIRIGPGKTWALVYIVPPFYVIVLLLHLAFSHNPHKSQMIEGEEQLQSRKGLP